MKRALPYMLSIMLPCLASPAAVSAVSQPKQHGHDTAAITAAPEKGIIHAVYPHYTQEASLYFMDDMPPQKITKDISRRFVMGANITLQEWHVKAGATLPLHYHLNEAIITIKKGRFAAYSQGKKYLLTPGRVLVIPAFVPHEFVALKEDGILVGAVSPARLDYLGDLAAIPDPSPTNKLLHAR